MIPRNLGGWCITHTVTLESTPLYIYDGEMLKIVCPKARTPWGKGGKKPKYVAAAYTRFLPVTTGLPAGHFSRYFALIKKKKENYYPGLFVMLESKNVVIQYILLNHRRLREIL